FEAYFKLGNQLNQRDTIAVRKTVSGMIKLIYPHGEFSKEDVEEVLRFAIEMRRRVKEQLKKIGGMEFFDVNLSYIDNETFEEKFVAVPEQGSSTLIPVGTEKPGHVYSVVYDAGNRLSLFKIETQMTAGNGKFATTGIGGHRGAKESMDTAYKYLKANAGQVSGTISLSQHDFVLNATNLNNGLMTDHLSLATYLALISISLAKPTVDSLVVVGDLTIGGSVVKPENLADTLQVARDSGAKKVLLPMTSAADFGTVPSDLLGSFTIIFYNTIEEAAFKALGVE
ncbi:MAG: BREX system Lon protease-like protein BrxL, partial [Leuconostoc mesenteroides]